MQAVHNGHSVVCLEEIFDPQMQQLRLFEALKFTGQDAKPYVTIGRGTHPIDRRFIAGARLLASPEAAQVRFNLSLSLQESVGLISGSAHVRKEPLGSLTRT